jgi:hypothetical protein
MSETDFNNLYEKIKLDLSAKFKTEAAGADILWGMSNQLAIMAAQKNDFSTMASIRRAEAWFQFQTGKNYVPVAAMAQEGELRIYEQIGIEKVQIVADTCCNECLKSNKKIIFITDAFEQKPIPNKACTRDMKDSQKMAWCTCTYVAVFK